MYEIRPDSIKTFISDNKIRLPRFQRRQTWDDKKNFQLCISLFKNYPIGVCILSGETVANRPVKYLLDGRQRRHALRKLDEDPENLYIWAKAFIKFKPKDQPWEVEKKFWEAIGNFLEEDDDEIEARAAIEQDSIEDKEEDSLSEEDVIDEKVEDDDSAQIDSLSGMELLLKIILVIHNRNAKNSGFTRPFDFIECVNRLPYVENMEKGYRLSSRGLKEFIKSYRVYCQHHYYDEYQIEDNFIEFLKERQEVTDQKKLNTIVHRNWPAIVERIEILQKIDDLLTDSKIGVIDVNGMKSTDYQKIFNLINSQGEPLKAIEVLSAKQKWNIKVQNPTAETVEAVQALYKEIGTSYDDVVRWDLPATLLDRLGNNFVFKKFDTSKSSDFVKGLTIGFKAVSGIYVGGVTKECIEELSSYKDIKWETDIDDLIRSVKTMFKILSVYPYFRYFLSWKNNMMEMTSDYVALDFFIIAYLNWKQKGEPIGSDMTTKKFQKECFLLVDRLIYEYTIGLWKSSADAKTKNNILALNDNFEAVPTEKWIDLLLEIFDKNQVNGKNISFALMKPLLYHFYCLNQQMGPDLLTTQQLDVDHIIPRALFENSGIENKDVVKDNLLNLGIITKEDNISKGKRTLDMIKNPCLIDQIQKYEFIDKKDFSEFSNVSNYQKLFDSRREIFLRAFNEKRTDLINNSY